MLFEFLKNKINFIFVLMFVQLILFNNFSLAVESQKLNNKTAQIKQQVNVSDVQQHSSKTYAKKWKKYSYKKSPPKNTNVQRQNFAEASSLQHKSVNKPVNNYDNSLSEQKPLNLSNYTEKKYDYEKMQDAKPIKGPSFLSIMSSLFFVILLIIIFGWFYSRLKNVDPAALLSGKLTDGHSNKFNILSTTSLGQGKTIHLVEICGRHLVLGSTINNISLLAEINQDVINSEKTKENIIERTEDKLIYEEDNENISPYNEIYKEYLKDDFDLKDKKDDK